MYDWKTRPGIFFGQTMIKTTLALAFTELFFLDVVVTPFSVKRNVSTSETLALNSLGFLSCEKCEIRVVELATENTTDFCIPKGVAV